MRFRDRTSVQYLVLYHEWWKLRRQVTVSAGSWSNLHPIMDGHQAPFWWLKAIVSQYPALPVPALPQSPGTTSASTPHPHHQLRRPRTRQEPLPSRRLRGGGAKLLSLSVSWIYTLCSGLAKTRARLGSGGEGRRNEGGLASFLRDLAARSSPIRSSRLHSSAVHSLAARATLASAASLRLTRPSYGMPVRFALYVMLVRGPNRVGGRQAGAIATMQFIGRISGNQKAARTENVPSHMRPGWYSNCTYCAPLVVESIIPLRSRDLQGTASDASPGEKG
jgi:hypothetical protein